MAADGLSSRVPSPRKVRVREKGQFTIPVEFRNRIGIGDDTVMEVYQVGKAIIVTPAELSVRELARQVEEEMEKTQYSLKDLLFELREGTHAYREED